MQSVGIGIIIRMKIIPADSFSLFKGRHFDSSIIILCVRWYITYKLSHRDLRDMMAERGVALTHTTILRWVGQGSKVRGIWEIPPVLDVRVVGN